MQIKVTVTLTPFKPRTDKENNQVQLDAGRNLLEAVATAVSTRQESGTIEGPVGSATFEVVADEKPAKK